MKIKSVTHACLVASLTLLGFLVPSYGAWSANPAPRSTEVAALTQSLVSLNARYRRASGAQKAQLLDELIATGVARHQALTDMIEDHTGAVLKFTLPHRLRRGMPEEIQAFLGQERVVEGSLETLYEDYDSSSRVRYFLDTGIERLALHFKGRGPRHETGAWVQVTGVLLDDVEDAHDADGAMALESAEYSVEALGGDGSGTGGVQVLSNTLGEQRTAVLLVNFSNQQEEPWTLAEAEGLVLGTTSDYFWENSFEQTWLTGDISGWYTLSISSTCNTSTIASAADSASGINLGAYDRIVYVFPRNTACGWAGAGTVGGSPSRSWVNGRLNLHVVSHELGHNFGLHHSNALDCGDSTLGINCTNKEYGDTMDTMGNLSPAHFNTFQKERLAG